MFYVLLAAFLFCASVTMHILFCRTNPKRGLHVKAYMFMGLSFLGIYILGAYVVGHRGILDPHSAWGLPFGFAAGSIFFLLIPIYMNFYTLTQLMSPSKKILLTVARRGSLSYEDVLHCVEEEDFINDRLKDLCLSGCVQKVDGSYRAGPSGGKLAGFYNLVQLVLGRDMGG